MDDGAKGLRQDNRQTAIDQVFLLVLVLLVLRAFGGQSGIEGHQRIDADHQFGAFAQRDGSVQRLDQRPIDEIVATDLHRRKQSGQSGAGLNGDRNRHVIVTGAAESHRFS